MNDFRYDGGQKHEIDYDQRQETCGNIKFGEYLFPTAKKVNYSNQQELTKKINCQ